MSTRKQKPEPGLVEAVREVLDEADAFFAEAKAPKAERLQAAIEKLRPLLPAPGSTPGAPTSAKKAAGPAAPSSQEEWDARVLAWALEHDRPITLDRAFAALAPGAPSGSPEQAAIATSLNRLPRDRFTFSWYMANTSLAPLWTRQAK